MIYLAPVANCIGGLDASGLSATVRACTEAGVADSIFCEAVLQGIPYSGFPGAIEALGLWRASVELESKFFRSHVEEVNCLTRGREVFTRVYGGQAEPVLAELKSRHPDLEQWILRFAYGRVMHSSPLSLGELEVLGVASLIGQGRQVPMHSHLRGAVRQGWTRKGLRAVLEALPQANSELMAAAHNILLQLTRKID